jgi:hypothetical protein
MMRSPDRLEKSFVLFSPELPRQARQPDVDKDRPRAINPRIVRSHAHLPLRWGRTG